jgi:hypothetical protein
MEGLTTFLVGAVFVITVSLVRPTINFVGSFGKPCKESFYNSTTLFEASMGCILRKK